MARLALLGIPSGVMPTLLVGALFAATAGVGVIVLCLFHASGSQLPRGLKATSKAQANAMLQRQAARFVPNLGQWKHRARFVHRSGPMTLFLEDRGWILGRSAGRWCWGRGEGSGRASTGSGRAAAGQR